MLARKARGVGCLRIISSRSHEERGQTNFFNKRCCFHRRTQPGYLPVEEPLSQRDDEGDFDNQAHQRLKGG